MKLDTERMVLEINELVDNDWGFDMIDCKNVPGATPYTQEESRQMAHVLGRIYSISHCVECGACQGRYVTRDNASSGTKENESSEYKLHNE
jgi:hypothetical protein